MPFTLNTNAPASAASFYLSRNQSGLEKSLNRLSSGSRIVQPVDDAGGLAVSMKMESAIVRLSGAQKNVQNATSFLEVQDGVLSTVGKTLNRMIELKGLSDDVMKNSSDIHNYNREFHGLQMQIYDMARGSFNGVSLFAETTNGGNLAVFNPRAQNLQGRNTVSVYIGADGSSGPTVHVNRSFLLSALTMSSQNAIWNTAHSLTPGQPSGVNRHTKQHGGLVKSFAAGIPAETLDLDYFALSLFTQAIQNIATLRADNGASMSRLRFAGEEMGMQKTNLIAANGRITDVDIAAESTRLAKYNVFVQASASMLAQANTSSDIALMLLK